jgi:predicted TIM-barrel fold metal-dependent hydrolase
MRAFSGTAREYFATNCYSGISPFTDSQIPLEQVARPSSEYEEFAIGCDNAMFGVDYPHFESVFPDTGTQVDALVAHPAISNEVANKILCGNAARVYGFDLDRLQTDIERVGFDIEGKVVSRAG